MTRLAMSTLLKGLNAKPFLNLPAHRFIWGYDDSLYALAKGVMSYQKKLPFERFGILAAVSCYNFDKESYQQLITNSES